MGLSTVWGGCTEYLRDGICPELELEKVVEKGVPLHLLDTMCNYIIVYTSSYKVLL